MGKLVDHFNTHVPFVLSAVTLVAGAVVLSTVHRALDEADTDEADPGTSHERADSEQAVRDTPGLTEEAVLATLALSEDRTLGGDDVDGGTVHHRRRP